MKTEAPATSNERGQAILEAIYASILLVFFFSLFVVLLWGGLVRVHADFTLHEYLVCKEQVDNTSNCKSSVTQLIKSFPPWVKYQSFKEFKTSSSSSAELVLLMGTFRFSVVKEVALPLVLSQSQ
jgi:hypothetical protein